MRIDDQLLFVGLLWPFSFLTIRQILCGVKELYLSKHEKNGAKKGRALRNGFYTVAIVMKFPLYYFGYILSL